MKRIIYAILILGMVAGFGLVAMPTNAGATRDLPTDLLKDACAPPNDTTVLCEEKKKEGQSPQFPKYVTIIVNTLLYVLAAVSVIVIIIAGFFYTTSGGDAALITKAKNTLLYAVIGLIVAIMAYAIVNYVITQFK